MPKSRSPLSYIEALRKLARAGIADSPRINRHTPALSELPSLDARIETLLGIVNRSTPSPTDMLFFVMYDIESNKVRRLVAKYLIDKGCVRIQRSIFLANLHKNIYDQIKADLAEVQSLYDNADSIIICPIPTEHLRAMKIIGENIDLDLVLRTKNTLFF